MILPQAIKNEYLFHGLIAVSRTIQLTARGKAAPHDGVVIFHRGQALMGIKEALSDVTEDVLPLAVMHMISLDVRTRNISLPQEHLDFQERKVLTMRVVRYPVATWLRCCEACALEGPATDSEAERQEASDANLNRIGHAHGRCNEQVSLFLPLISFDKISLGLTHTKN